MNRISSPWFTAENDEVGGFSIVTEDVQYTSLLTTSDSFIGDFITRLEADHIVRLHNEWLWWMKKDWPGDE